MAWQKLVLEIMKPIKYIKQERGALVVLTAVLLPVLFGFMGIAYDVGNLYMHKARLQNVTDAAALAGGEVFKNPPENDPQYTDKLTGQLIVLQHKHEAADGVAGDYIKKNEVNLGNNITILERSALGYKGEPVQSGNVTTGKTYIYYRVIATEEVPVYFLPVIMSDKTKQKVKATSVALVETTTTITQPSSSGESTPVRNPSIFDNLFTYSEYFDPGLTNAENNIKATFEGNMVFTYGDGSGTQGAYYNLDAVSDYNQTHDTNSTVADHLFIDSHANPNAIVHSNPNNSSNNLWSSINDPIIDTFYNTTAYVEAFKNKLKGPHRDETNKNPTITGDGKVNNGCIVDGPDNLKFWLLGEYYPLNTNGERLTFTYENKTYYVCYHKLKDSDRYLRVAQNDEDSKLDLIGDNNAFTGFYIGTKEDGETIFNASGVEDVAGYNQLEIKEYAPTQFKWKSTNSTEYSNIFHIGAKFSNSNNTTITIKNLPEGDNPLYIIIDSSINGTISVIIKNNNSSVADFKKVRPVILVYFGTSNIKLEAGEGSNDVTNLSVYAPYGTVGVSQNEADQDTQIHLHGSLYGNIVAKRIAIDTSGNTGAWHQKNFLQNDEDIVAATKDMLNEVNAKTVPETIKAEVKQKYAEALADSGVTVNMEDPYFYSKLNYEDKITLYRTWENLCNQDQYAEYKNMLWPWNDHFDLIIPEQEDITPTVDSNSVIRIINPKIEDNPYFSNDSKI